MRSSLGTMSCDGSGIYMTLTYGTHTITFEVPSYMLDLDEEERHEEMRLMADQYIAEKAMLA